MNRERMKELAESQFAERQTATTIVAGSQPNTLNINGRGYELVKNYRDAYDEDMLAARFSTFLEKYDYLVGDIASGQLRLRGFYEQGTPGIARNQQINSLEDYLFEDINFGAPYFVLHNLYHGKKDNGKAEIDEKKKPVAKKPGPKPKKSEVKVKGKSNRRHFEVRERKNDKPDTKGNQS